MREDIEIEPGDDRIAQRILLLEEPGIAARRRIVPRAPFVDCEHHALGGIIFVHDRRVLGDEVLHLQRVRHGGRPFALGKADRRALVLPVLVPRPRVVMQREAIDVLAGDAHHRLGPFVVGIARAAGDLQHRAVRGLGELRIAVGQVGGIFGAHVAAAAPQLVADTEILDLPRRGMAVALALLGQHRRALRGGHVLDPLRGLGGRCAADIGRDVGAGVQTVHQSEIFVRAEAVVLVDAAPVGVDLGRARLGRADPVAPMIFVRETPAGPAHHRHVDRLQRVQHVPPVAAVIGDARILADPDPAIDAVAEMLGELAEHVAVDDRAGLVRLQRRGDGRRRRVLRECRRGDRGACEDQRRQCERTGKATQRAARRSDARSCDAMTEQVHALPFGRLEQPRLFR